MKEWWKKKSLDPPVTASHMSARRRGKKIAFLLLLHTGSGNNRSARVKRETPGPGGRGLYLARRLI